MINYSDRVKSIKTSQEETIKVKLDENRVLMKN
jgi:hypothetical protein